MTTCIIAEKPSVARDIAHIVGATSKQDGYMEGCSYLVTWAMGHLIALAMPESYGFSAYKREDLPIGKATLIWPTLASILDPVRLK